jgi:monoamine oxidase
VGFVRNLGFIGEAFSGDYWGYMEGAVQTGWLAAKHVVDELV